MVWLFPGVLLTGVLLTGVLLAGCAASKLASETQAHLTREFLHTFWLSARFSLRHDGQSYLGRLHWRHEQASDVLTISSPFGQALAEIVSNEHGASLTSGDGREQTAASVEELLQEVVGYPLPLKHLADWLRADGSTADAVRDHLGRLLSLRHNDWRIEYEYDRDDGQALPARVFVAGATGLQLRLRIEEWRPLSNPETTNEAAAGIED